MILGLIITFVLLIVFWPAGVVVGLFVIMRHISKVRNRGKSRLTGEQMKPWKFYWF